MHTNREECNLISAGVIFKINNIQEELNVHKYTQILQHKIPSMY